MVDRLAASPKVGRLAAKVGRLALRGAGAQRGPLLLLLLLLLAPAARADFREWFVATNGSPANAGSFASPWDLRTALAATNSVRAGDRIYLFGGIYSTNTPQGYVTNSNAGWTFKSYVTGVWNNPIYIRSYTNNNLARLDGGQSLLQYGWQSCARPVLSVGDPNDTTVGAYNIFQDIEFFSSSTETRLSGDNSDFPTGIRRSDGPYIYGTGSMLVNCKIHDLTTGGSSWAQNVGGGFYGCEFWNNGWQGTPNAHGHNIYTQSRISAGGLLKTIARNLFSFPYKNNIQAYGSSTFGVEVAHYRIAQNAFIGTDDSARGVILLGTLSGGSANRVQDNVVSNNWTYGACVEMYYHADPSAYADLRFIGNYLVNSYLHVSSWQSAVITNNLFFETSAGLTAISLVTNTTFVPWTFDRNNYVLADVAETAWRVEYHAPSAIGPWRTLTGYEPNSVVSAVLPATNYVILLANAYDSTRANLVIYNWSDAAALAVDVSGLAWGTNANYALAQSQNPLADVAAGTITATNTIIVDMQAASHTVAIPYGATAALGPTTFPRYGQFALRKLPGAPAAPPTAYTLSIASSNPTNGTPVSASPADNAGASNGQTPFTRQNNSGIVTTLTAPASLILGKLFEKWQFNGATYSNAPGITITNTAAITMTAVYTNAPAPQTTNALSFGGRRRATRF